MANSSETERAGVQSVRRALDLLRSFTVERPERGVTELAAEHGLHPSSISRLLATLAEAGLVRSDPSTGRYRLGFGILELATIVRQGIDVRSAALPRIRELALTTGNTVNLAILDDTEAVVIDSAPGHKPFIYASWIGRRRPVHASAHGKALLAFQPPKKQAKIIDRVLAKGGLERFTEATITTRAQLESELAVIRERGYAANRGETGEGVASVAAPIRGDDGSVIASVSIPDPLHTFTREREEQIGALVADTARQISADIGFIGEPAPEIERRVGGPQ